MIMRKINCVGDICPVPVIKTKKALAEMNAVGSTFEGLQITVDNEIAVQNISKMLNSLRCSFSTSKDETGHFLITVEGADKAPEQPGYDGNNINSPMNNDADKIVIISSEFMGYGDDVLGKILIKGFIFALTQLETLPKAVIFYNSGVRHVLKNSETIKDLQYLQQQGVEILACGTCLNHFNALADLAVGGITDMYNIVNLMQQAARILKP